jgi:hypothetical protein
VQGAWNSLAALLQDMGTDHGRRPIVVPEQWLNGADVGAALEQVSGEGMTNGVGADVLRQTGTANRHLGGVVDDAGGTIMATGHTRARVNGAMPGRKDLRPPPCLGGIGVFPGQRMGEVRLAMPLSRILLMQRPDPGQVVLEQRGERSGNGGEPVFVALARTDGQWLHLIVDVLDPEPDRFDDAPAAPVGKFGNQWGGSIHERDDGGDFFACHDHGNVDLLVDAPGIDAPLDGVVEDARVEEHQGSHGLVLGGSSDVSMHRQVGQE